jgi:hypothetical protein
MREPSRHKTDFAAVFGIRTSDWPVWRYFYASATGRDRLRTWASGRCQSAIYVKDAARSGTHRRVARGPIDPTHN